MNVDNLDRPAGTGLGFDCEFDGDSSSLPSGWSWVNQGTATYLEANGAGVVSYPGASGVNWRGITRSLSGAPASWLATIKQGFISLKGIEIGAGMVLRESSSGKFVAFYSYGNNTMLHDFFVYKWTNVTTASGNFAGPIDVSVNRPKYLRIRKNSATSFDFECSEDNLGWYRVAGAIDVSAFMTPDEIGIMAYNSVGAAWAHTLEWLRIR